MKRPNMVDVDALQHYKQAYKAQQTRNALLIGCLIGLAAGLFWEAIRR